MERLKNKIYLVICGVLILLNIFAWVVVSDLALPKNTEINFFNVGQGDSAFIQTPQKLQVLIDGGPDSTILRKLAQEMPFYDRAIDLIILTHPDKDHMAGLLDVFKNYKIENILWTGIVVDTKEWKEWINLIENEGANIKIAQSGQKIILEQGIFLDVLEPSSSLEGLEIKKAVNDTSAVVSLKVGERSFLFTGDIGKSVEQELADRGIKTDVLKVAHHGSKNSILEGFYKVLSPEFAVISVGKNSYGHPSASLLDVLENLGIETFRTDKNGDVKIITDGKNLIIN